MTPSAIIFDLDGVLADSETWWSEIDAKLLAEYAVTYHGEHHQQVVGVSYRLAVEFYKKAFVLSVPTEEMMRHRGEIATEFFANRIGLFPNVKEVLEELLGVGVTPVIVGTAAAEHATALRTIGCLLVALGLQIGVNYANDYSDGKRGVDTASRVGPVRLTASGLKAPRAVATAALISFAVSGIAGLLVARAAGWWLLALGACPGKV